MADKHLIQYDDILRFSTACFQAMGTSDEGARIVSEHLSLNNLYGHDSHGMIRIPQYYDATQVEFCNATAVPEILRESDTTAVIEGHRAWGQGAGPRRACPPTQCPSRFPHVENPSLSI